MCVGDSSELCTSETNLSQALVFMCFKDFVCIIGWGEMGKFFPQRYIFVQQQ